MYILTKQNKIYATSFFDPILLEYTAIEEQHFDKPDIGVYAERISEDDVVMADMNLSIVKNKQIEIHNSQTNLVSDLIEQNGKTVKQNNLEQEHDIPVGTLVELLSEETNVLGYGDDFARLYVLNHSRDCDGTPLYDLGLPSEMWTVKNGEDAKRDLTDPIDRFHAKIFFHYPRESFRVVKKKQVWLNIETGEFSNSWQASNSGTTSTQKLLTDVEMVNHKAYADCKVWKLIEFECLSDGEFEFNKLMRLR